MDYQKQAGSLGINFDTQQRLMEAFFRVTWDNYGAMKRSKQDAEAMRGLLHHIKGASLGLQLESLSALTEFLEREWERLAAEVRQREIDQFRVTLETAELEWKDYERDHTRTSA